MRTLRPRMARTRAARPTLEGLEARALLSSAHASHAEISALGSKAKHVPIVAQLATAPTRSVSTIPANGDVNPYGVVFVPNGFARGGVLNPGDVLVSNFNSSNNFQGTGTTIERVTPNNQTSVFYQGPPGVGLDAALGILKRGFVLVGSLPSTDGTSATVGQGSLLVLNKNGQVVANLTNSTLLDGPWGLAVQDNGSRAQIFISNVLNGTVTRIDVGLPAKGGFNVLSTTQIASGYAWRGDPTALEVGPTGLAYDSHTQTLYVASTDDNAIYAVPNAGKTKVSHGTGKVIYQDNAHLRGPLGLTFVGDGNLITTNGDVINGDPNQASELVEFTKKGKFVAQFSISTQQGAAFGVASSPNFRQFAAVNDATNEVQISNVKPL